MKPIYFAYIRKSTDTGEKQAMSIDSQKIEINRFFGDKFEIEFFEEKKSAYTPYNRPVLDDMLRRLEDGEAEGLLAWDPSRVSRNEIDAARITYAIRKGKIKNLEFCAYTFQNSPEGIMMLQMALSQSQYESSKKGKDVMRQMLQKCERGWFPETAPNGYLNQWSEEYQENIIAVDPMRFPLIRKAIDLVLSRTLTPPQALRRLNNEWGYKSVKLGKKGARPLGYSTWYTMLSNKFYYGVFSWASKEYQGKHVPMVTPEEFDQLQRILGNKGKPRPKKHDFAFSGTMTCATCGYSEVFETKTKFLRKTQRVQSYTVSHCSHKSKTMGCNDRVNLNENKLVEQIKGKVMPLTIYPLFLEWALDIIEEDRKQEPQQDTGDEMAIKSLHNAQEELRNFARMKARGQINEPLFLEEKARLEKDIIQLEKNLNKQKDQDNAAWVEPTRKTFDYATYAIAKLHSESLEERRSVLIGLSESPKLDFGTLIAEPYEYYFPIIEWNRVNRAKIERLEPIINGSESKKKADLEDLRLSWLGTAVSHLLGLVANLFVMAPELTQDGLYRNRIRDFRYTS